MYVISLVKDNQIENELNELIMSLELLSSGLCIHVH